MAAERTFEKPRWLRDLLRFLPLKSQFVLSGNVRDLQLFEAGSGVLTPRPMLQVLAAELRFAGFAHVISYDPAAGFKVISLPNEDPSQGTEVMKQLGLQAVNGAAPAGLELFTETLQRIVGRPGEPVALVADFASRMIVRAEAISGPEHQAFTRALVLSHQARSRPHGTPPRPFFNTVLWVVDKEGDLPDWLLIGNPRLRHVPIAKPDHRARRPLAASLLRSLDGYLKADPLAATKALDDFVDQTEGLLLVDLTSIVQLGRTEGLGFAEIADAVRRYKVGVTEDPWRRIDRARIRGATDFIRNRVKGQEHAVVHMLDIIKRAVTGVGAPRRGGRPRGVAFLAGPTGVGKTELAKTITHLLFGDQGAYIRFDMSEFSAEHSDQRLIGAPPGYVGYDVGGELTNAIRERPFSVVLFDEIEKAHPRILDKFLQILDDGVLTSGRGDRVYFSEAFIVFTSNLGIYRLQADGSRVPNVTPEDGFTEVEARVRSEIEHHFKAVLNRPEILNRIGDNVLVFDFIRPAVAEQIFADMVESTLSDIASAQGISVRLDATSLGRLRSLCLADLSNGGRGIRNKVETHLLNPLARALFDADASQGQSFEVRGVELGSTTMLHFVDIGTPGTTG
ncbi:AAA family ATPase [Stigmatella aurantiaca]|uniref:ATP-dependent Clp protease regulatory subunit n=1 Tax=Stigmatella aurantiaca (strain DW4/3-1) TaxID=378806 RepID=Q08RR0_STIAD|nr:AAA family ATPase [Stigmatella aurantiaca]ADO72751.1 ATP-dependent Clp protease regulatory subunit [Stigmatella aurantiaca DW4/3-1]EAU63177.1 ATP-dependent Clp protease regulatory subunit [Stigmatella aurantiaca DW4/3-1]